MGQNVMIHSATSMLVVFPRSKTAFPQDARCRVDHVVEVRHPQGIPPAVILYLSTASKYQANLFTLSKRVVSTTLAQMTVPPPYLAYWKEKARLHQGALLHHFTLHSIKRGAVQDLWAAAACGKIPAAVVPLLAKHKVRDSIPPTTVGYTTDITVISAAVGTAAATAHL